MIVKKVSLFILIFLCSDVFGQAPGAADTLKMDTIVFLNGEVKPVKILDTAYHLVRFFPDKRKRKPQMLDVEKSKVFSLKYANGFEKIMYFHDTIVGNMLTVLEAKMYVQGEREADKNYKNKWPAVIGFIVGSFSPLIFSNAVALSPVPAAVIPLHTLIPVIKINTQKIENKDYLQYDTYLMGYEKVARKKNFMNALIGTGIGLAIGFGTWAIPDKVWNDISGYDPNSAPLNPNAPFSKKAERFSKRNFVYGVWAGEVGCVIGFSMWKSKKNKM